MSSLRVSTGLLWTLLFLALLAAPPLSAQENPLKANELGTSVLGAVQQLDGKIIIVGDFVSVGGVPRRGIARLYPDATLDLAFDPHPDAAVKSVALSPDGQIVFGGDFTSLQPHGLGTPISRAHLARVNADGSVDASYAPAADGKVAHVFVGPDGRALVSGSFTTISGAARPGFARLGADGAPDGLNPHPNGSVDCMTLQPDGQILIGGHFTALGAVARSGFARLNANGTVDLGFNPSPSYVPPDPGNPTLASVAAVVVQPDGKIVFGGFFNRVQPTGTPSPVTRLGAARVNPDGTLDAGFDLNLVGAEVAVTSIQLSGDGNLVVGGVFHYVTPHLIGRDVLLAFADGTLRPFAFFPEGGICTQTLPLADGRILYCSQVFSGENTTGLVISLGSEDATASLSVFSDSVVWHGSLAGPIDSIAFGVSTDGGSHWTPLGAGTRLGLTTTWQRTGLSLPPSGLLRAQAQRSGGLGIAEQIAAFSSSSGAVDSFDAGLSQSDANFPIGLNFTAVQPDDKILIQGYFTASGGVTRTGLARLNAGGTLDQSFWHSDPDYAVTGIAVHPEHGILVNNATGLERVRADGLAEPFFTASLVGMITCTAVQTDGKILCGRANGLARLNTDGTVDSGFSPQFNSAVTAIALQSDGKILVSGNSTANRLVRLNSDGTLDAAFDPHPDDAPVSIVVQADGKILLGGNFTSVQPNGAPAPTFRAFLARLNADGTLDAGFNPTPDGGVFSIAVQADGKILIVGSFSQLQPNGAPAPIFRNTFARLLANGTVDSIDAGADNLVSCVALQSNGAIVLGGYFTSLQPPGAAAPIPRAGIARLYNGPALQTLSAPDAGQILWVRGGSVPELFGVIFEVSTDGGHEWARAGVGTRVGTTANWQLTGLSLPATGLLRARGLMTSGLQNASTGVVEQISTFSVDVTPAPTLLAPASGVRTQGPILVDFSLPEAAASGSVTLRFGATSLRLAASQEAAGEHSFTLDPANPLASPEVAAVTNGTIADGSMVVALGYGDLDGHPVVFDQHPGFVLDRATLAPLLTAPASHATTSAALTVSYTLPESGGVGTVRFRFAGAGTYDLVPVDSYATAGPHTITFDPGNPGANPDFVTAAPISAGVYTVTVQYQDDLLNPAASASATNVQVSAPEAQTQLVDAISQTSAMLHATMQAHASTATVSFLYGTDNPPTQFETAAAPVTGATATAEASVSGLTPGTAYFCRAKITNAAGTALGNVVGFSTVPIPPNPDPVFTALSARGGSVPNPHLDARLQAGSVWVGFGTPAVNDSGAVAFIGKWSAPAVKVPAPLPSQSGIGLFVDDALLVKVGDPVPGLSGVVFKNFKDPVMDNNGFVAFLATITSAPGAAPVPSGQDTVVMANRQGTNLEVLAREGDAAPGANGGTFKAFASVSIQDEFHSHSPTGGAAPAIVLTASLLPGSGAPAVTTPNDTGAWWVPPGGTLGKLIREGDPGFSAGETIRSFLVLKALAGSAGQGHGTADSGDIVLQVGLLKDRVVTQGIVVTNGSALVLRARTGDHLGSSVLPGATWLKLGLPSGILENGLSLLGTLAPGPGVPSANTRGIFQSATAGSSWEPVARIGDPAPGFTGGATFANFRDPVNSATETDLAFLGTAKGGDATPLTNDGVWFYPAGGAPALVAREGGEPPGAPGAQWRSFSSLALAGDHAGPYFTASLVSGIGGVTSASDFGLYGPGADGVLRELVREGQSLLGKTVKTFNVLKAAPGSAGATRAFNNQHQIVLLVTFSDLSTAIVRLELPTPESPMR